MTERAIPQGIASAAGASRLASNDWERLPRSSTRSPVRPAPARSNGNADRRQGGRQTPEPLPFTLFGDIKTDINKEWLCAGLIGAGELSALYGVPGSGKSVLGGSLAVFIARGTDWMGRKVKQGAAVIVAAERTQLTKRRLAAERLHGGSDEAPVAVIPGPLDLCHGKGDTDRLIATMEAIAKETRQPVVFVLIDTVSQVLCGGDENSPKDMGNFISNVTRIVQKTGAHVMLVHHSPADNPQKLRGHTALLAACDTTILVSKAVQIRRAEVMKANDAEEGVAFTFDLESVELGIDQDGNVTGAPVVVSVETEPSTAVDQKAKLSSAQQIALKALQNALGDEGKVPPANNYIPSKTATVSVETWRRYAYSAGVSDTDNPEARKKAFQRVRDALKAKQHVWEHEGQAWIV